MKRYFVFSWLFISNQVFIFIGGIIGSFLIQLNDLHQILLAIFVSIINFLYCFIFESLCYKHDK